MIAADLLRGAVRDIPDFPKPGIIFKDITPILGDGVLFRTAIDLYVEACAGCEAKKIAGIEARGFMFGAAVADRLGLGFVPIRKKGKLPWQAKSVSYDLEYGTAEIEMHVDAVTPGERVVLIDDLLATGGTAAAAVSLLSLLGADVVQTQFLIELSFLNGRSLLGATPTKAILTY